MATMATSVPLIIVAGTKIQWTIASSDYSPDDGYTLTWSAVVSSSQVKIVATDYGNGSHLFTLSTVVTAAMAAGIHRWQITASDGTDDFFVSNGQTTVESGFASATSGIDARGEWQVIYEELMDAYKDFVVTGGTRTSFSIAGRSTTYTTAEEFIRAIHNAKVEADNELATNRKLHGEYTGRRLVTRMQ